MKSRIEHFDHQMAAKLQARLQLPYPPTWYEDGDGSLHSSADDVIHCKHPVGLNVMVPQDFVHLINIPQGQKPVR